MTRLAPLLTKEPTDISHIQMTIQDCLCGCGKYFLKNEDSKQKYASAWCLEIRGSHVKSLAHVNRVRNANGLEDLAV